MGVQHEHKKTTQGFAPSRRPDGCRGWRRTTDSSSKRTAPPTRRKRSTTHCDAECFRLWVREAAQAPSAMATLIMRCTTEQEYRDAIMPCVHKANAAIFKASKA